MAVLDGDVREGFGGDEEEGGLTGCKAATGETTTRRIVPKTMRGKRIVIDMLPLKENI